MIATKKAQENFLRTVLHNEGNSWAEFFKYVKRRKGGKENVTGLKDSTGMLITEPIDKANVLNSFYASVFSCKRVNQQIPPTESGEPFSMCIKTLRKRLASLGNKKSVGPDGIPGAILKLGGEAMIPYLARLMDIALNNNAIPNDWKKAIVIPFTEEETERQLVTTDRLA